MMSRILGWVMLITVFGFVQAHAQLRELEVTPAQASGSIPVFTNHPEMAAVIVNSSLTSLQFDSNVGIVEELSRPNDGYYVLIVRPWRQIITVTAPGFRQSRFTVSASQAREVLYYTIEPLAASGNLVPVNFVVNPTDAVIYVNNQVVESGRTNQLPAGRQALRIERSGYRTIEQEIDVSLQNTLFTYQLQEVQVTQVVVRSEPAGATLFIDDINVGNTTYANFVYPGVYNIRLILANYRTLETQITVEEDGANQFNFPLERFVGELQLTVTPTNARVFLNRQDYSGQSRIQLPPGRYQLEIDAEGHERFSEQIELVQNQPLVRTVNLTPLTGNLQFAVRPVEATASLFNSQGQLVEQWQSLRILRNLPVGRYTLRVEYPGHQTINETITIAQGQTLQFDRTLVNLNPTASVPVQNTGAGQQSAGQSGSQTPPGTGAAQRPTTTRPTTDLRGGPTRTGAVTRSLFIPGGGQIYSGKTRGYLYLLAAGGAGAYAYLQNQAMMEARDDHAEAMANYRRATTLVSALETRKAAEELYRDETQSYDQLMMAVSVAAGVYVLQLLDAAISSPGGSSGGSNAARIQPGFTPNGISVRIALP